MLKFIVRLMLPPLLAYQVPEGPKGWTVLAPEGQGFIVSMPNKPNMSMREIPTGLGKVPQHTYSCNAGPAGYVVQRLHMAAPPSAAQAARMLDQEQKSYHKAYPTLVGERDVVVDGVKGHEFALQGPAPRSPGTVTIMTRHLVAGSDYFAMSVISAPDRRLPADAMAFLDSFRLTVAPGAEQARPSFPGNHPEDALRSFMMAMITGDRATLKAVTMPDLEFDWLLGGKHPDAEAIPMIKLELTTQKIRRLKAGDKVALPAGRSLVVGPDEVVPERAILLPEGAGIPTRLQLVKGRWLVDARPIIAARKAAEAASRKAATKVNPK